MKKAIGCDLGSNTLRIVELTCKNGIYKKRSFERVVKTAWKMNETSMISQKSNDAIIKAFLEAKNKFDFAHTPMRCVATQAFRKAKNTHDVISAIQKETNVTCTVISSNKEAKLSSYGVDFGLLRANIPKQEYILIDMGGASTEFICKNDNKVHSKSFPFGVISIANECTTKKQIENFLHSYMRSIKEFIKTCENVDTCIAIAGTPTTIAAYKLGMDCEHYDEEKVNNTILHVNDFENILNEFQTMDKTTLIKWVGVGRSEVIKIGVIVFIYLMKICHIDKVLVFDEGLAEGVAMELVEKQVHK